MMGDNNSGSYPNREEAMRSRLLERTIEAGDPR